MAKPYILGDRFEILAAATAALLATIPIAHIHGGETTEGAIDESIRHAITKMAQLHFVAARPYRDRVIQLGEHPRSVFEVGGLGVDAISGIELMARTELEQNLGLTLGERSLVVTFHPTTLQPEAAANELVALFDALDIAEVGTTLIFTMPNADTGGRTLMGLIDEFVASRPNAHAFTSLGQRRYLSLLGEVDGVIGNSSSGLLEAPTFKIGTVNIGERQAGRLKAASVIDCLPTCGDILRALRQLRKPEFARALQETVNPYGVGGASKAIIEVLCSIKLNGLVKKQFYDLPAEKVS